MTEYVAHLDWEGDDADNTEIVIETDTPEEFLSFENFKGEHNVPFDGMLVFSRDEAMIISKMLRNALEE